MKNYILHIPEGVKDFLWREAKIKEEIQHKMKAIFSGYSYSFIETPTFEYMDVFTVGEKNTQKPELYKWVNRQGEVVALRNDMTRAIARVAATQNANLPYPQRYAYMSNIFRYPERYQGKVHEFTQGGIELIGEDSYVSDAEVIQVAITTLREIGIENFTIHLGSSEFLSCVLKELGLGEAEKEKVFAAIERKDAVSLEALFSKSTTDQRLKEALLQLIQQAGTIELVHQVKEQVTSEAAKKALTYLENIYTVLEEYGTAAYILFDFNVLSYAMYYTGMMFQGFTTGVGSAVVEGGRYNKLLCEFGKDLPAVGFGVNIQLLLQKLVEELEEQPLFTEHTLILYEEGARKVALQVGDLFRKQGIKVENGFAKTKEAAMAYAKEVGIGGILYFKESGMVEIYQVKEGTSNIVAIDTLLQ